MANEFMGNLGFELAEIARLVRLVEQRGIAELIVEDSGRRLVVRGASYAAAEPPRKTLAPATEEWIAPPENEAPRTTPGTVESRLAIESPMVGVFYRALGPDQPPLVEVGDHVEVGQTIGLIEAMKVFSEIPSEHAGVVVEIVATDNQLVRAGEPLLYLRPEVT